MKKSLTVVGILALLFATWPAAPAQTKSTRFDPSGAYWISGEPPADFSDFSAINVNMRQLRRLPTSGMELNDGTRLRFKTVVVKQSSFTFTTATVKGVYYTFSGKFLKGGVLAETWQGDEEPVLEGTLTKFKAGTKVADAKLKFIYFGGT
ncbi:MAG TPA: hypothetical protein VL907_10595 [Pyrinomonadaceae bacterium]|jgi:hypothetical protein|nr:hypothetical protein [Pyrinomonadaceae bacterium]